MKPKSNTKVFGLGFAFTKIKVLSAFFGCGYAVVSVFSGFVWRVRIALSIAVADGFMPRKVRGRQKGVCQAILPKANEKPLWDCRLAVYLPTDTLLRDSGQEHRGINRLRMYQIRNPSLSELFGGCLTATRSGALV